LYRLTVGSGFGSNYWNRPDPTIPTLGIDPKPESIPIILEPTRPDPSRYSILILGIESNCQGIENYVIMPRITNFRFFYLLIKCNICIYRPYRSYRCNLLIKCNICIYRLYRLYRCNLLIRCIICIYRLYRIYRCDLIIFFVKSSNALL